MCPPFPLLLLVACLPGRIFAVRRPVLRLELPCEADTGLSCSDLYLLDVPVGREEQVQFTVWNDGEVALSVRFSLEGDGFSIEPTEGAVPAGGSLEVTLGFSPSGFEDVEGALEVRHDALGGPVLLDLHGSTDDDADQDGYRTDLAPGGDDCNDFNASVNPGAIEVWYDGLDQDCDGLSDYDQDRDGHDIHTRPDGDDCDDVDPNTYPDAPDPPGDGIDQDCDGADG